MLPGPSQLQCAHPQASQLSLCKTLQHLCSKFVLRFDSARKRTYCSSSRSPEGRKQVRGLLPHLGILVVSICAILALLEIGIRIVKPQDEEFWDSQSIHRILATSPHFVENIPHGHANFIGVPVTINSYGLRGRNSESVPGERDREFPVTR